MAELEAAMGNRGTSATLVTEEKNLAAEFETAFWNSTGKRMDIGVQTDIAISLDIGMPSASVRSTLAKELVEDLQITNNVHMTTGIIGAKVLLPVLSQLKRDDLAFDVASQVTYPSWGYMRYNGIEAADAIWELLDAPVEVNPPFNPFSLSLSLSPHFLFLSLPPPTFSLGEKVRMHVSTFNPLSHPK